LADFNSFLLFCAKKKIFQKKLAVFKNFSRISNQETDSAKKQIEIVGLENWIRLKKDKKKQKEKIMKKRLIIVAVVTILLSIIAINANSNPGMDDKTIQFTGGFGITNPCNGEFVNGPIQVNIVVNTAQTANGPFVTINHSSQGTLLGYRLPPLTDPTGNEYQISRHAKGKFNAFSSQYIIPWRGEFVGKGTAPNFSATGELRVFVNAEQEPTGSNLVNVTTACN